MNSFQLHPRKTRNLFVGLSLIFMALNLLRVAWFDVFDPDLLDGVWARLDMNQEPSVPTWFSAMVLSAAAVTLAVVAKEKRQTGDRFTRHWTGLAAIFTLMSIDEISSFHELFVRPLRHAFGFSGPFFYAWVIPGGLFVILFVLAYLPFLSHLSPRFRTAFIVSGGVYVFGALVMEMVGGEIMSTYGPGLVHTLEVTVEEGCEMLGASFFVYAVLSYLQTMTSQVTLGLVAAEVPAPAAKRAQQDAPGPELSTETAGNTPSFTSDVGSVR